MCVYLLLIRVRAESGSGSTRLIFGYSIQYYFLLTINYSLPPPDAIATTIIAFQKSPQWATMFQQCRNTVVFDTSKKHFKRVRETVRHASFQLDRSKRVKLIGEAIRLCRHDDCQFNDSHTYTNGLGVLKQGKSAQRFSVPVYSHFSRMNHYNHILMIACQRARSVLKMVNFVNYTYSNFWQFICLTRQLTKKQVKINFAGQQS